jgi:flagellar biosynthesis protein FlhG
MNESTKPKSRVIAVLSGKGGSGKTMIVAVMASYLMRVSRTLVVDADTGTAGMSYFLGLESVANIRVGLSNVAERINTQAFVDSLFNSIQPAKGPMQERFDFLGIGDHRKLERVVPEDRIADFLKSVIASLRKNYEGWILIDCRGGIDRESLAVCGEVDDIIVVTESDTTSFQATKHVVDVLSDNDLAHKVRGFIINKVFDNPSVIVAQGTSVFGTQFLSAIPFDLRATRSFLIGRIPFPYSPFSQHVLAALHRAYPESVKPPEIRPWRFEEYRELGLTNLDSIRGGFFAAASIFVMSIALGFRVWGSGTAYLSDRVIVGLVSAMLLIGFLGSMENTRRLLGRLISSYLGLASRLYGRPNNDI